MRTPRDKIFPETLEQANILLDTIRMKHDEGIVAGFSYLLREWPAMKNCTHAHIANLLGMARETVTRNIWQAYD